MSTAEEILRRFERDVLDKHHESLSLWNRPRNVAVYAALAQFDCWAILPLVAPLTFGSVPTMQRLKNLEEGLSEALRWLHTGDPRLDLVPTDDRNIIQEAGEFCLFAGQYVDIADFHKMYGRGQVDLEVDEAARVVRFVMPTDRARGSSIIGITEQAHRLRSRASAADLSESLPDLREEALRVIGSMGTRYEAGHVILDDVSVANHDAIRALVDLSVPTEPFPLADNEDLVGFTAGEFNAFFGALRRWSFCCTAAFLHAITKGGKQQWQCAPTQCLPRGVFLSGMGRLSGLAQDTVQLITQRMTYRHFTVQSDVYLQPLFGGEDQIAWSASVVQNSKHQRNMLKLMSRIPSLRDHAAGLIGRREMPMLQELGLAIARRGGMAFKLHTPVSGGDEVGEVDLLAYNRKSAGEVLIVEGKAVLGVDEINEVESATVEMQNGQQQLAKVKRILELMPDSEKARLFRFVDWTRVRAFYGVVVAGDAEPSNNYDHSEYPGISAQALESRLRDSEFASPRRFWSACKERKWLEKLRSGTPSYNPVAVADVTYELPVLGVRAEDVDGLKT